MKPPEPLNPVAVEAPPPRHVGIIMDGNGRWARRQGLPRLEGHRAGARAVDRVVTAARERGIGYLTLYAFSEQNWRRPPQEVEGLMELLLEYVRTQRRKILDNNIRLVAIGRPERLPSFVRLPLNELIRTSRRNDGMVLALALSYGGREEIVEAARRLARRVERGELSPEEIDEAMLSDGLSTADMPDPDLIIRTSGEARLSNFLLWQAAYAELYFTEVAWPDFDADQLDRALTHYASRERRFGLTGEQIQSDRQVQCSRG